MNSQKILDNLLIIGTVRIYFESILSSNFREKEFNYVKNYFLALDKESGFYYFGQYLVNSYYDDKDLDKNLKNLLNLINTELQNDSSPLRKYIQDFYSTIKELI